MVSSYLLYNLPPKGCACFSDLLLMSLFQPMLFATCAVPLNVSVILLIYDNLDTGLTL